MSIRSREISSLSEKINLLLESNFNNISSQAKLAEASNIDAPQINRWVHPTTVGIQTFKKLCNAYADKIPPELWEEPLEIFAEKLGLESNHSINGGKLEVRNEYGIDFESRLRDKNLLQKRFEIMKGCWEMYCYSLSILERKYLTYGIVEIIHLNDDGFLECIMGGENLDYHGYCFFVGDQTHFQIEAKSLANEILYITTNSPKQILNPMMTGILSGLSGYNQNKTYITPTAVKVALCHVGAVSNLREKYQLSTDIPHEQLADKIENILNSGEVTLSKDILDAIDNHIPHDATPYALRADVKNELSNQPCDLLEKLREVITSSPRLSSLEKEILSDYQVLFRRAFGDKVYRFVKLSQYYERIMYLAKNTTKSIIATYLYDNYDYNIDELLTFGDEYVLVQKHLISEQKVTVSRLFIIKSMSPDDFLLKKMYEEEQAGIDVSYLQSKCWTESTLVDTIGIVDFALFDEEKAIVLGEKESFCAVQSASIVTNIEKISVYKESFITNRKKAKTLTNEMRERAALLLT